MGSGAEDTVLVQFIELIIPQDWKIV
jgi:hypothetical protein